MRSADDGDGTARYRGTGQPPAGQGLSPAPTVPSAADRPDPLPESIVDAAIQWAVQLNYNQASARQHLDFAQWRDADPLHDLAWQRVNGLTELRAGLDGLPAAIAHRTLAAAQTLRAQRRRSARRGAIKLLSAAGALTTAGWLLRGHSPWQRLLADVSTRTGERRTLRLDDGSVVMLNTDSAIGIDFAGSSRLLVLHRGEILVTTGPDTEAGTSSGQPRPLRIRTPVGRLEALGTRFTARLQGDGVLVGVQQGAVRLEPAGGAASTIVSEGDSGWLEAGGARPAVPQAYGPDDWAEGVVSGKDIPLRRLLAELERYRAGRIVCDPAVAELRVSGLFHLDDTDRALAFLARTQPLRVTYRTRYWVNVGPVDP